MTLSALRLSLDTGRAQREQLPAFVSDQFLGGRGAAAWMLAAAVTANTAALAPGNCLIFSAGPLAGALPTASGGFVVTTRSPLTNGLVHSWALGSWGAALRRAGHDLLALEGQSPEWCVVQIDGASVSLRNASHLLGLDTSATVAALRQELGDGYVVACIGPAGVAGVAYASIVAEGCYPAEPAGTGAVMAAKRVKAIAVRGSSVPELADGARARTILGAVQHRAVQSEVAAGLRQYGSLYYAERAAALGAFSARNGQDGEAPPELAGLRSALARRGRREPRGCDGCPVPCHTTYLRKTGEPLAYPELEALAGFGAACGITNPDALIVANDLCLRLGLDVVETSAALAFMMECQQAKLSTADTLRWGDADAVIGAIRRLGATQEKRDVLSLGVGEMKEIFWSSGSFAPQAKGLALPALDPRALRGLALALATAPIGGDYRYAMLYEELLAEPPAWLPSDPAHPQAIRGKASRLIWYERYAAALDSAGLCRRLALMAFQLTPAEFGELLTAALGRHWSAVEIAKLGERVVTLERITSTRFGVAPDGLPKRWSHVPLSDGPAAGALPGLNELLPEYYRRHGWSADGTPPPARLAELGIADTSHED